MKLSLDDKIRFTLTTGDTSHRTMGELLWEFGKTRDHPAAIKSLELLKDPPDDRPRRDLLCSASGLLVDCAALLKPYRHDILAQTTAKRCSELAESCAIGALPGVLEHKRGRTVVHGEDEPEPDVEPFQFTPETGVTGSFDIHDDPSATRPTDPDVALIGRTTFSTTITPQSVTVEPEYQPASTHKTVTCVDHLGARFEIETREGRSTALVSIGHRNDHEDDERVADVPVAKLREMVGAGPDVLALVRKLADGQQLTNSDPEGLGYADRAMFIKLERLLGSIGVLAEQLADLRGKAIKVEDAEDTWIARMFARLVELDPDWVKAQS